MNTTDELIAFGAPGIEPCWTSSAKEGVGTAYHTSCRLWFTLSHGIINEIYYPRVDQPILPHERRNSREGPCDWYRHMKIESLRSPYQKLGGLYHFGRMLDKIRLHQAGQLPTEYHPKGALYWSCVFPVGVNPGAEGILSALEQLKKEAK
jgi:hypothetical protein